MRRFADVAAAVAWRGIHRVLTQPQLLSLVMIAGGGIWLWLRRRAAAPAAARAAA